MTTACGFDTEVDNDPVEFMTIDSCANKCKEQARMFAYGTNYFGGQGCKDGLCKCHCATTEENDITCTKINHHDYWFYEFKNGKNMLAYKFMSNIKKYTYTVIRIKLHLFQPIN